MIKRWRERGKHGNQKKKKKTRRREKSGRQTRESWGRLLIRWQKKRMKRISFFPAFSSWFLFNSSNERKGNRRGVEEGTEEDSGEEGNKQLAFATETDIKGILELKIRRRRTTSFFMVPLVLFLSLASLLFKNQVPRQFLGVKFATSCEWLFKGCSFIHSLSAWSLKSLSEENARKSTV